MAFAIESGILVDVSKPALFIVCGCAVREKVPLAKVTCEEVAQRLQLFYVFRNCFVSYFFFKFLPTSANCSDVVSFKIPFTIFLLKYSWVRLSGMLFVPI